jgi:hypothetical protein
MRLFDYATTIENDEVEVWNVMAGLRTKATSLQGVLANKDLKGIRFTRQVVSLLKESITKNINEETEDFDHGY